MKRTAIISIESDEHSALAGLRAGFLAAWRTGDYQTEIFSFASPSALFAALTPKRWALLACLQTKGPLGIRALARELARDVRRVHDDAAVLVNLGLIERDSHGKLKAPFDEIKTEFILSKAA